MLADGHPGQDDDILAERSIPMHYGQKELDEDLAYARSCQ